MSTVGANEEGCFGAGYLEGALSAEEIYQGYLNYIADQNQNKRRLPEKVEGFIGEMLEWVREQIREQPSSAYWKVAACFLSQYEGMYAGYQSVAKGTEKELMLEEFHVLTFMGDLEDLMAAYGGAEAKERKDCTGIVTEIPGEVLVAHNTHNIYSLMLRIFKTYHLQIQGVGSRSI